MRGPKPDTEPEEPIPEQLRQAIRDWVNLCRFGGDPVRLPLDNPDEDEEQP